MPDTVPRFSIGDVILRQYVVTSVLRAGEVAQFVVTQKECGSKKVVKIISRLVADMDRHISQEVKWLQSPTRCDSRHAVFEYGYQDQFYAYLVFTPPLRTLRDIVSSEDSTFSPLAKRQIREISLQVVAAVLKLHSEGITHTDIRPENVEFLDDRTFEEMVYHQSKFVSVRLLWSTELRLAFYGCIGLRNNVIVGHDQYRSPEMVYNWGYSTHSDAFSVGCLIAEMVLQRPLFIPCNSVRFYQHEKTLQFQTVLGPFSEDMIRKIHSKYSTIFDRHDGDSIYSGSGVSEEVLTFAANADSLQDVIEDPLVHDVVEGLTRLDVSGRVLLEDIVDCDFFRDWY